MKRVLSGLLGLFIAATASAITVTVDYSLDKGYFSAAAPGSQEEQAKQTIEAAAQDLSAALNAESASLNAVDSLEFSGSDPARSLKATIDWDIKIDDPSDPAASAKIFADFSLGSNVFKIFAGKADALDSLDALGEGAPASGEYSLNAELSDDESAAIAAIQSAVNYSNGILLRGAGPTITSLDPESPDNQVALPSGTVVKLPLKLGALAGFLTFNSSNTWHFDHTTMPGAGEYDFYTVMLHEMMHALGLGTSDTWKAMVVNSGKDWNGPNAIAANGGVGVGLINDMLGGKPDGGHIKNGTMSEILGTNTAQEAVMTASLAAGVRRKLTKLDVAFLKDLGYGPSTAAPTPPPLPTPVPPTPTPTPTPPAKPPEAPILLGKPQIKTSKPSVKIKGVLIGAGVYVQYKIGNGPYTKAKGGKNWNFTVKVGTGKTIVTVVTFDPASGKMSKPKKITITKIAKAP